MNKFSLLLLALLLAAGSLRGGPLLEEITENIYPAEANVSLSVRNTDGQIYIFGAKEERLKITVRKRAYSRERLEALKVEVKSEGDTATIETIYPPMAKGLSAADRSGTVDYQILVPQHCTLSEVELSAGEIILEGMRGPSARVSLTNGRVMARNCFTDLKLKVANGVCDIFYDWWETRPFAVTAEIGGGTLRTLLPPNASLRVDARSRQGNARNGFWKGEVSPIAHAVQTTIGENGTADFVLRADVGNIDILKER